MRSKEGMVTSGRQPSSSTQVVEHDPLIGVVLHGYRIDALIGRGRAATVYRARHPVLRREVAIKILGRDLAAHPEQIERFRREAQALSRMRHPNIVEVLDFGTAPDGRPFLTMELVHGHTLESDLARTGPVGIARFIHIARQLASGLAEAHSQGLIHRDLKPSNIMLLDGPDGEVVKILDFGIVRFEGVERSQLTDNDLVLGTPRYMAPEQVLAPHAAEPRSDLYALGVVLYEMLSGKAPFEGSLIEVLDQQLHGVPPAMATETGFEPLIGSLLQKNVEDRPPSADALVDAIDFIESLLRSATQLADPELELPPVCDADSGSCASFGSQETVEELTLLSSEAYTQIGGTPKPTLMEPEKLPIEQGHDTVLSPAPEAVETALDFDLNPELKNRPLRRTSTPRRPRGPDETRVFCEPELHDHRPRENAGAGQVVGAHVWVGPPRQQAHRAARRMQIAPRLAQNIEVETSDRKARRLAGVLGLLCCALLAWLVLALQKRAPIEVEAVRPPPVPMVIARQPDQTPAVEDSGTE